MSNRGMKAPATPGGARRSNAPSKQTHLSARRSEKQRVVNRAVAVSYARTRRTPQGTARIRNTADGLVVSHNEFFTSVVLPNASTTTLDGWTIQPGWSTMFPWLSGIAERFERYEFEELSFEYVPRVPTSSPGTIVLAIDPDPWDIIPDATDHGRQVMLSHPGSLESSVWSPCNLHFPKSILRELGHRFVETGIEAPGPDIRLTASGLFLLGLFGCTAPTGTATYGDLRVHYRVRFHSPQLPWVNVGEDSANRADASAVHAVAAGRAWAVATGVATGATKPLFEGGAGTSTITLVGLADSVNKTVAVLDSAIKAFHLVKEAVAGPPSNRSSLFTGDISIQFALHNPGATSVPAGFSCGMTKIDPTTGTYSYFPSLKISNVPTANVNTQLVTITSRVAVFSYESIGVRIGGTAVSDWYVLGGTSAPGGGVISILLDGNHEYIGPTVDDAFVIKRSNPHLNPLSTINEIHLASRHALLQGVSQRFYGPPPQRKKEREPDEADCSIPAELRR